MTSLITQKLNPSWKKSSHTVMNLGVWGESFRHHFILILVVNIFYTVQLSQSVSCSSSSVIRFKRSIKTLCFQEKSFQCGRLQSQDIEPTSVSYVPWNYQCKNVTIVTWSDCGFVRSTSCHKRFTIWSLCDHDEISKNFTNPYSQEQPHKLVVRAISPGS